MGIYPDSEEKAGEIFRLTVAFLAKHDLIINPVNFSLAYHYVSGEDPALNRRLDELLQAEGGWEDERIEALFRHYVCLCNEAVLRDLREELMDIVAHTLGTMIDLTGKTSIANERIQSHINTLAESNKIESVMKAVSSIISETRTLITETSQFETELLNSTEEVEKLREELSYARQEAMLDPLTGVLNRRGFDQALTMIIGEVEQQHIANFCLVLMDIDNFKEVNDNHGHILGDKVLRAVAELLTRHTKGKDACARFGGDEFAILLPDIGSNNAQNLAEYIRSVIEKIVLKRPTTGTVVGGISASMGVAAYRHGEAFEDFLNRCDEALYRSKTLGRNRVTLAD
ncbi:MAG: GGDEF domain-containing protein [gamma proteobacterium symbiont of Ctena orbiculata]|nr:GGDEF domain-containing protein [Candidatus Thiodiazotropha taylori]MBT3060334.1 GGDEF domain-containing protein [Candidatus Thiodiazotropha sp. (ex Lucina pensylvanica)]MBT3064145.1 GGDEF domain-containing protein [Candidatus Thiodiazotropha sp. (ex Lucina pensylvanica)]MBV2095789.1 GGDEF domain-containing protein [Candidatus Thiodiazotropha sp. (ex Codakia orbicularis)]